MRIYEKATAITPADTTIAETFHAIYVGSIGGGANLAVRMVNGQTVTLVGVVAGTIYPIAVDRVMSTNTTASSLVGLR